MIERPAPRPPERKVEPVKPPSRLWRAAARIVTTIRQATGAGIRVDE